MNTFASRANETSLASFACRATSAMRSFINSPDWCRVPHPICIRGTEAPGWQAAASGNIAQT